MSGQVKMGLDAVAKAVSGSWTLQDTKAVEDIGSSLDSVASGLVSIAGALQEIAAAIDNTGE